MDENNRYEPNTDELMHQNPYNASAEPSAGLRSALSAALSAGLFSAALPQQLQQHACGNSGGKNREESGHSVTGARNCFALLLRHSHSYPGSDPRYHFLPQKERKQRCCARRHHHKRDRDFGRNNSYHHRYRVVRFQSRRVQIIRLYIHEVTADAQKGKKNVKSCSHL